MRFVFFILFLFFSYNCSYKKAQENTQVFYDLTRLLNQASIQNFQFDEKKELTQHWKKNPNRYSKLPQNQKWLSIQITFQEDPNVFRNTSKESILFTPNSEIYWEFPEGNYIFYFSLSKVTSFNSSAYFEILENENSSHKIYANEIPDQKWKDFQIHLQISKRFKLRWVIQEGYLFLGNPILISNPIQKPNIILIVIDSMRRDTLGCTNLLRITPNLDELCKHSLLFMNHYSNANWTKPSMISLFFGEYASNLGITNPGFQVYNYEKEIFYKNSEWGLINTLRKSGYFTESIMNNVFLLEYTGVGVDLGFHSIEQIGKDYYDTEEITKASLKFLRNRPKEIPFFLHINYNAPHGPYDPPVQIQTQFDKLITDRNIHPIKKRYLAEIFYTDLQIGKLVEELKNLNELENTWILVTSDHGEMFSIHHTFEQNGISGTLYGHGQTLYEEEIAVPLLIFVPEKFRFMIKNWVYNNPSSNVSIYPTLLGLLGIENYEKKKGADYSKFFFNEEKNFSFESIIYSEGRMMESILAFPYKYIRYFPGYTNSHLAGTILSSSKAEELYNLEKDPLEKENLITSIELLNKMRKKMRENLLNKNAFYLFLPSTESYEGVFFSKGEIYFLEISGNLKYNFLNRFFLQFKKEKEEEAELVIYTTHPLFEHKLNFYNSKTKYRIGKWQIINGEGREQFAEFLVSNRKITQLDKNLPLLYNDGKIVEKIYSNKSYQISGEVQNILKSWGYIHE